MSDLNANEAPVASNPDVPIYMSTWPSWLFGLLGAAFQVHNAKKRGLTDTRRYWKAAWIATGIGVGLSILLTVLMAVVLVFAFGNVANRAAPIQPSTDGSDPQANADSDAQTKSDLRNVATLEESGFTDYGAYTTNIRSDCAASSATLICYHKSANASTITGFYLDSTGRVTTAITDENYCLSSRSDSGSYFVYNSLKGGLQPEGSSCS